MNFHENISSFFAANQHIPASDRTAYVNCAIVYVSNMISKYCTPRENQPDYIPLSREFIIRTCMSMITHPEMYSSYKYDSDIWIGGYHGYHNIPLISRIQWFNGEVDWYVSLAIEKQLRIRMLDTREPVCTVPELKDIDAAQYRQKRIGHRRDYEKVQRKKGLVSSNKATLRKEAQYKHARELVECF